MIGGKKKMQTGVIAIAAYIAGEIAGEGVTALKQERIVGTVACGASITISANGIL